MFNDIAYLCAETTETDSYLNEIPVFTEREVFVEPRSIGTREFYQAAVTDFEPDIKLVLADYYDYQNERVIKYDGIYYDIIRTYRDGTRLELTLQERMARNV